MADVETLGQVFQAGWRIKLRCARGHHRGVVRIDECRYSAALDVETLVCTRGRACPLSRLASRMMCPNCGDRNVWLTFEVPESAVGAFVPKVHKRWRATKPLGRYCFRFSPTSGTLRVRPRQPLLVGPNWLALKSYEGQMSAIALRKPQNSPEREDLAAAISRHKAATERLAKVNAASEQHFV